MVTFLGLKVKEVRLMDAFPYCPRHAYIVFESGENAMVDAKDLMINAAFDAVDINLTDGQKIRVRCA